MATVTTAKNDYAVASSTLSVGIIGALGDMGQLYARKFASAGLVVHACDLPARVEDLRQCYAGMPLPHAADCELGVTLCMK